MSEKINFDYNKMTPFKWFIIENYPFLEDSIDGLTNYQLFTKLGDEINKNRDAINEIGLNAEALTEGYNALHDFVYNYFDNLDVQDEIDNKLDEMTVDGTLTALIKNYIDPLFSEKSTELDNKIFVFENSVNNNVNSLRESVNRSIDSIENQVNSAVSGTPLIASSISQMTDTGRIYVNTSDGNWYYYNGSSWAVGGTYQSSGLSNEDEKRLYVLESNVEVSTYAPTITGSYINNEGQITQNANFKRTDYIPVGNMNKIEYQTVIGSSLKEVLFFDDGKSLIDSITGRNNSSKRIADIPDNTSFVVIQLYSNNAEGFSNSYIKLYNDSLLRANVEDLEDRFSKAVDPVVVEPSLIGYGIVATNSINNTSSGLHTDF